MKTKKRFFLIAAPILMAMVLSLLKCSGNRNDAVNCLAVFITVGLSLEYPDGQPVLLDSSKVFWISKNRYLEQDLFWWQRERLFGNYTIVNDLMRRELRGRREMMRFTGYLDGEIVHKQYVLVGAGYCHVEYLGTEPLTQIVHGVPDAVRKSRFCELITVEDIRRMTLSALVNTFVRTIDEDLPYEDKLQMIVGWLLSHDCITDARIDCVLCVPTQQERPNNSRIAFSFVENEQIVNVIMVVAGNRPFFAGLLIEE